MLYDHRLWCDTLEEFEAAIEVAIDLCMKTDHPLRISGSCSPLKSKLGGADGNGHGCMMFSYFSEDHHGNIKQVLYTIYAKFPINHDVFPMNYVIKDRLRAAGKIICFWEWEEDKVTHVLTVPWNNHSWEYSMVGDDSAAVWNLLKYKGSQLRRTENGSSLDL